MLDGCAGSVFITQTGSGISLEYVPTQQVEITDGIVVAVVGLSIRSFTAIGQLLLHSRAREPPSARERAPGD